MPRSRSAQPLGAMLGLVAGWMCLMSSTAGAQPVGTKPGVDELLPFVPDRFYNPSLVEYNNQVLCTIKLTDLRKINKKTWWMNSLQLCTSPASDLGAMTCAPLQPWGAAFTECELDARVRGGKVDSSGLGDVKVWVWPGKGVYAIFGTKPQHHGVCNSLIVYHQWLIQLVAAEGLSQDDPWRLMGRVPARLPLPLLPVDMKSLYPAEQTYVMEKNWMPWVHKGADGVENLYVTYSVYPHQVMQLLPDGSAILRHTTENERLFSKFTSFDVHGGPPVVYVPAALSASGQPYYLGIMHHIERLHGGKVRHYRHFAFRFQPDPPFQITHISDELPLVFNQTYKWRTSLVSFVSGLYLSPEGLLSITYGAADINSRIWKLKLSELEAYFTGDVSFTDRSIPDEHGHYMMHGTRLLHTQTA